jgi:protein-tyrosine phosphatase
VPEPFTVLFVCIGNVCRSPLAERLLRERLRESLGELSEAVTVESAGVRALAGRPMESSAAKELERLGLTNESFRARQLNERIANGAGLVLTATKEIRSRVLEEAPGALRRTFTITEFAALVEGVEADTPRSLVADASQRRSSAQVTEYDVPDPIGAGPDVHRQAADLIDGAVTPIAEALATAVRHSASDAPSA